MRLLIKLLVFAFCTGNLLTAQPIWQPIGNGLSNDPHPAVNVSSTIYGNDLYVTYATSSGGAGYKVVVEKWNGVTWVQYPVLTYSTLAEAQVRDIQFYNGDLHICGDMPGLLKKFDGSNWVDVLPPGPSSGSIMDMDIIGGDLILVGAYNYAGSPRVIMEWDGSSISFYPAFPTSPGIVQRVLEYNSLTHVVGLLDSTGSKTPVGCYRLSASNVWESPVSYLQGTSTVAMQNSPGIFEHQGDLFVARDKDLFKLEGDTAHLLQSISAGTTSRFRTAKYGSKTYVTLNGAGIIFDRLSIFDGTSLSSVVSSPIGLDDVTSFMGKVLLLSPTQKTFTSNLHNYTFLSDTTFSILKGKVFNDANYNCQLDPGEKGIPHVSILLQGLIPPVTTDINGNYSFGLLSGAYSLDTIMSHSWLTSLYTQACPQQNVFSLINGQVFTNNIGFRAPNYKNIGLKLSAFNSVRHGDVTTYWVEVVNLGGVAHAGSGAVELEFPAGASYVNSLPAGLALGNSITWNLDSLDILETKRFIARVRIDSANFAIGDNIGAKASLLGVAQDSIADDDWDSIPQVVSAAYDPNNKVPSDSVIGPKVRNINYRINFQNTGTDVAHKVVVIDTLNLSLPLSKVVINSSSHNYQLQVQGNVLRWIFDKIMLPDSTTDFHGSQGYVSFSTGLAPSVTVGDTVINDAHIFFDYQLPIHTNLAKTAVVTDVSIKEHEAFKPISVYPNPASQNLNIELQGTGPVELTLYGSNGQILKSFTAHPGQVNTYYFGDLVNGIYYLTSSEHRFKILISN